MTESSDWSQDVQSGLSRGDAARSTAYMEATITIYPELNGGSVGLERYAFNRGKGH